MKKKTIGKIISFNGIGLHSGQEISIKLLPRKSGGIVFINDKNEEIQALFSNVVNTQLGTTISNGRITVKTIEHLMAGIFACDLDNLTIKISGEEIPILDGSAKHFIEYLKKATIINLKDNRKFLKIIKPMEYSDGDKYIKILPDENFSIDMNVNFQYGNIGEQRLVWNGEKKLFSARTFCNLKEIEFLWSNGLSKGGTLENAMVFDNNGLLDTKNLNFEMSTEESGAKMIGIAKDYIKKYGENSYNFRMENEVVYHKTLDCIGDMLTSGYYIKGKIVANKTGHELNNQLLRKIFKNKDCYVIE
jgi:UDP-3-O-[3-hydroxymyristoyl] N-acetylglucosamine deacetylase